MSAFQKPPTPRAPVLPLSRPKPPAASSTMRLTQGAVVAPAVPKLLHLPMAVHLIAVGLLTLLATYLIAPTLVFVLMVMWLPWPLFSAYAQHQRGGRMSHGAIVGLLGPLGLLIANYSRPRALCPHCRSRIPPIATHCLRCQGVIAPVSRVPHDEQDQFLDD